MFLYGCWKASEFRVPGPGYNVEMSVNLDYDLGLIVHLLYSLRGVNYVKPFRLPCAWQSWFSPRGSKMVGFGNQMWQINKRRWSNKIFVAISSAIEYGREHKTIIQLLTLSNYALLITPPKMVSSQMEMHLSLQSARTQVLSRWCYAHMIAKLPSSMYYFQDSDKDELSFR
jgi:hypothetical protein